MTPSPELLSTSPSGRRLCDGDPCFSSDPWPIHHIGNLAAFRRLCTPCLLRRHRNLFCSICLELLHPPPSGDLLRCLRCPSAAHSACAPGAAGYLCPMCQDPDGGPGLRFGGPGEEARALLTASRIAADSMRRAAAAARGEAERKARQAAAAGRIAREMLERAMVVCGRRGEGEEKENMDDGVRVNGVLKLKKMKKRKKKRMRILSSQSGLE